MRTNFLKTSVQPLVKKLHFFDWLVLAGIAVIIVFFFYLRAARQASTVPVRILFTRDDWGVQNTGTPFWIADGIQPGDTAHNSLGNVVATVREAGSIDTGGPYRNAQVVVDLAATYDTKTQMYSYNYQPLQPGRMIDLSFQNGTVRGLVLQVAEQKMPFIEKRVKLIVKEVLPETASEFVKGLQALDSSGEPIATIDEVAILPNEYYEFSHSLNRNVVVQNPQFRNVEITVRLKAFESSGIFYYVNNAALKVGNELWLEFPRVSTEEAIITAME